MSEPKETIIYDFRADYNTIAELKAEWELLDKKAFNRLLDDFYEKHGYLTHLDTIKFTRNRTGVVNSNTHYISVSYRLTVSRREDNE